MFEILVICQFGFPIAQISPVNGGVGEGAETAEGAVYRKVLHKCSIEYSNTHRS